MAHVGFEWAGIEWASPHSYSVESNYIQSFFLNNFVTKHQINLGLVECETVAETLITNRRRQDPFPIGYNGGYSG